MQDALWYLIFMGTFGLVVVFLGCAALPLLNMFLNWMNPPPTPEQLQEEADQRDPKLQLLLSQVDLHSKVSNRRKI